MIWLVIALRFVKLIFAKHTGCAHTCTHAEAHAAGINSCVCVCEHFGVRAGVCPCVHSTAVHRWLDFIVFIQSSYNQVANTWAEPQALGNSSTKLVSNTGLSCAVCNTFWLRQSTWAIFSNSQDIQFWQHAATSQHFPDSWWSPKEILHLS